MSAHCNRVAVEDGHTESVSVKLRKKAEAKEIIAAWREFRCVPAELNLPSAPERPVRYSEAKDRPQPRFDVECGERDDDDSGQIASLQRARLEVYRAVAQHDSRSGRSGAA